MGSRPPWYPTGLGQPCPSGRQATGAASCKRLGCPHLCVLLTVVNALPGFQALPLAFQTAGDANEGLLIFGMDIATLQQWTLIYLGISSLAFVLVWLIGFLRR